MKNYFEKAFDYMNHNFPIPILQKQGFLVNLHCYSSKARFFGESFIVILQKQGFLVNFHFMGWIKIVLASQ